MDAAPAPGTDAAYRPTVHRRPWIAVVRAAGGAVGHHPTDPAVRRFWTAVVGPGAVADLLRLVAAASSGRRLRRPLHLDALIAEGLVTAAGGVVAAPTTIPLLDAGQRRRLHPALRAEYVALLAADTAG